MVAGAWETDNCRFGAAEILVLKYTAKEISHKATSTEVVSSTGKKQSTMRKLFET